MVLCFQSVEKFLHHRFSDILWGEPAKSYSTILTNGTSNGLYTHLIYTSTLALHRGCSLFLSLRGSFLRSLLNNFI